MDPLVTHISKPHCLRHDSSVPHLQQQWPIVELLAYSQTLGLSTLKSCQLLQMLREGEGFSWYRQEAAVAVVHVVNSGRQGLFAR